MAIKWAAARVRLLAVRLAERVVVDSVWPHFPTRVFVWTSIVANNSQIICFRSLSRFVYELQILALQNLGYLVPTCFVIISRSACRKLASTSFWSGFRKPGQILTSTCRLLTGLGGTSCRTCYMSYRMRFQSVTVSVFDSPNANWEQSLVSDVAHSTLFSECSMTTQLKRGCSPLKFFTCVFKKDKAKTGFIS